METLFYFRLATKAESLRPKAENILLLITAFPMETLFYFRVATKAGGKRPKAEGVHDYNVYNGNAFYLSE